MKRILVMLMAVIMAAVGVRAEKVGLVLSGGGAKGIAHVGVIKALEDNDIPIDCITGTSMGAIVGALYACGYTPEEMLTMFTSKDFGYWSSGTLDPKRIYYITRTDRTPQMFSLNFSKPGSDLFSYIPAHLISPMPMNMEFLKLFGPYSVQCGEDFDRLMVPYRCVTSDIYHKHKIVCRDGSLGEAVRESMSFPLVFKPIERDSVLVYDGGIYDNFPVDVMTDEFKPDIMVGSNVSAPDGKPIPGNVYSQLEDMIIQNNDYDLPEELGVKIDVPVLDFGVLDWDKAREIYDIGYKTAMKHMPEIKRRVATRRDVAAVAERRARFKSETRPLVFDDVRVEGVGRPESEYLDYVFSGRDSDSITVDRVEEAYYQVVSGNNVSDLEPQLKMSDDGNVLVLKPDINDKWNIGLGAWLTTATNSMLYLDVSYNTLRFNAFDAAVRAWIGQSYLAGMADFKIRLRYHDASYLQFQGVMMRQKYYNDQVMFFKNDAPTFLTDYENYARINYVKTAGRTGVVTASVGYAYQHDDYYSQRLIGNEGTTRDKSQYRIWQLRAAYESNTLDNDMYPSTGTMMRVSLNGLHESTRFLSRGENNPESKFKPGYRAVLLAKWKRYIPVNKRVSIGVGAEGAATFGPLRQNYVAELIHSPEFTPTPSMVNYFNPAFRSPSYLAAGVMPVWKVAGNLQARGDFYLYSPVRDLKDNGEGVAGYEGWFREPQFFGEIAVVYNFPFASLSLYGNYMSSPAHNWNFGISFGLLLPAPKFIN